MTARSSRMALVGLAIPIEPLAEPASASGVFSVRGSGFRRHRVSEPWNPTTETGLLQGFCKSLNRET